MTSAFLPSMRQLVAIQLRSKGMSQSRIASLLGTTQASVSVYLSSGPKRAYQSLEKLNVSKADADRYAEELTAASARSSIDGIRALTELWTGLLGRGSVCDAHRALHPSLAGCDFCMVEYGSGTNEVEKAVSDVAGAVRRIEAAPEFVSVMPEVSVNLACATPGATAPSDVVAVPGRIVKVKGKAKAMLPPERGASVHMAKVLLLAGSRQADLRACINLRYDRKMKGVLRRAGLKILVLAGSSAPWSDDPTVSSFETRLKTWRGGFEAIVEEGGGGIEPNVYLFARTAGEVAELAIRLARDYSAA
jgi:XRE family transcriptional regulator, thiamine biosynthesis regulator